MIPFITDRIRRMGDGNVFSLFKRGEGVPRPGVPTLSRGYLMMGVSRIQGWGNPSSWDRTADGVLEYTAVGMSLAFTQEDFLVKINF